MSWSLSWVAFQGKTPDEVQTAFGLKPTNDTCIAAEAPLCGRLLPSGWYIVIADRDLRFIEEAAHAAFESLSANAVACGIYEHGSFSSTKAWRAGTLLWSVSHDGSRGGRELEATGAPPDGFDAMREAATARYSTASGVDFMFDVPLELAQSITGFRHDTSELEFVVLEPTAATANQRLKPWWKFW